MPKLEFATEKMFKEQSKERTRARRSYNTGIKAEYRKHRKIFSNDFHHLYSTGLPFGAGR